MLKKIMLMYFTILKRSLYQIVLSGGHLHNLTFKFATWHDTPFKEGNWVHFSSFIVVELKQLTAYFQCDRLTRITLSMRQ